MRKDDLMDAVNARLEQIDSALTVIPDENATEAMALFRKWAPGMDLVLNQRLQHAGKLYKVNQPHTSQEGWEPDKTPALFTEIPRPGEIPVWRRPTGAQDAYAKGDKVHYPGKDDPVYESLIDANTWSPEEYSAGWKLVS